MKVLGIVCSPRRGGNTEIMMNEALENARSAGAEVELITLADKKVAPCDGCRSCIKTGKCKIDDDMQPIYNKLLEADGIILGSPVYFWGITAQGKALIDRTYAFLEERRLRGKVGAAVVSTRRAGEANVFAYLNNFFMLQRMNTVGGAMAFGGFEKGEVRRDEQGMAEARGLGRAVVKGIQRLQPAAPKG